MVHVGHYLRKRAESSYLETLWIDLLTGHSPLSLCKYLVRNRFLAGPPLTGLSRASVTAVAESTAASPRPTSSLSLRPASLPVRLSGLSSASGLRPGEGGVRMVGGGAAGSTTGVAIAEEGGECAAAAGLDGLGRDKSRGCIWQSLFIFSFMFINFSKVSIGSTEQECSTTNGWYVDPPYVIESGAADGRGQTTIYPLRFRYLTFTATRTAEILVDDEDFLPACT